MSLIRRMTHLIKADMHGILDHLEEPEALLKQAVREMKEQIAQREESLAQLRQRRRQSLKSQRRLTKWGE